MITGIHHINLVVPPGTLALATDFYATTLGLTPRPVPHLQREKLAWFDIGDSGQSVFAPSACLNSPARYRMDWIGSKC